MYLRLSSYRDRLFYFDHLIIRVAVLLKDGHSYIYITRNLKYLLNIHKAYPLLTRWKDTFVMDIFIFVSHKKNC